MGYSVPESNFKPKRIQVPLSPVQGVKITITKLTHYPAIEGTKEVEKVTMEVEDIDKIPHYVDFLLPKSDAQGSIRDKELKEIGDVLGIRKADKKDHNSYKDYIFYHLGDAIGKEARIKIVYALGIQDYNPLEEKNVGKSETELKKFNKPFSKVGAHPFLLPINSTDPFTFRVPGVNEDGTQEIPQKYHDYLDFKLSPVVPDGSIPPPAPATTNPATQPQFRTVETSAKDDLPF